ncbi:hypothetical protein [Haloarchaeobius baliensis]|uniref:hypothetical protein n=1 Tax=Haloarchaeobius baliensis TaxID=1670458 RepID=UPI003F884DB6
MGGARKPAVVVYSVVAVVPFVVVPFVVVPSVVVPSVVVLSESSVVVSVPFIDPSLVVPFVVGPSVGPVVVSSSVELFAAGSSSPEGLEQPASAIRATTPSINTYRLDASSSSNIICSEGSGVVYY